MKTFIQNWSTKFYNFPLIAPYWLLKKEEWESRGIQFSLVSENKALRGLLLYNRLTLAPHLNVLFSSGRPWREVGIHEIRLKQVFWGALIWENVVKVEKDLFEFYLCVDGEFEQSNLLKRYQRIILKRTSLDVGRNSWNTIETGFLKVLSYSALVWANVVKEEKDLFEF